MADVLTRELMRHVHKDSKAKATQGYTTRKIIYEAFGSGSKIVIVSLGLRSLIWQKRTDQKVVLQCECQVREKTIMSDEQLIELVEGHPVLYDSSLSQYRDLGSRTEAWENIAALLNTTGHDCRTRWAKLRNCYTKSRKRRRRKVNLAPWKFESQMQFLLAHLESKETDVNEEELSTQFLDVSEDSSISTFSTRCKTNSNENNMLDEMAYVLGQPKEIKRKIPEMDENDYFFLSMSKQMKRLPRKEQSNIKLQLHKLIYDAEMKTYSTTDGYDS